MSITAYIGINGSGKTYEVVRSVILPAFLNGRRVVTNIAGVTNEKFIEFISSDEKLVNIQHGEIVPVSDNDVNSDNFLPYKGFLSSFCQPGDLICIDEAWRFWETDKMLKNGHRSFFAEHRHFSDAETGFTCDVVLISQDLGTLSRFIRARIETTYRMQKHVSLGLTKRYRVDVFMGAKTFKKSLTSSYQEKYDPKFFPLYSSHDGSNAVEARVDERQNIFRQTKIWVIAAFCIVSICASFFFVWSFLTRNQTSSPEKFVHAQKNDLPAPVSVSTSPPPVAASPLSRTWRISGTLKTELADFVVISDGFGTVRLIGREVFVGQGMTMFGLIDGERVTWFSGDKK
ncbi:zonular occludens toxin family protein [Dickeya dadantii]|uniref:zonular occludens toxin family protein n=1 Tax=Dickeya dadantii TaxID=204038 RepID=UPI0021DA5AE1|nr:zonular occludens toxin domain-containing protein [Dickeya dadantii]